MIEKARKIFKTSYTSRNEIRDLLQAVFVSELLNPSERIWLVSPWLSDICILDNSLGSFNSFEPGWNKYEIRFTEVLVRLMTAGSKITVVIRNLPHNLTFIEKLKIASADKGCDEKINIVLRDDLHIKGLLCDSCCISGSMNFTFNGIEILDEGVNFETDKEDIAQYRIVFANNYGGID